MSLAPPFHPSPIFFDAMDNIIVPLYHVRCYPSESINSSRGLIRKYNISDMLEAML